MFEARIASQNTHWQGTSLHGQFSFKRHLFSALWDHRHDKLMTYVTGPRRVGKTVLFKQIMYDLINLDQVLPRQILWFEFRPGDKKEDIEKISQYYWDEIADHSQPVFVFWDEIQFVQDYEIVQKYLYDLYEGKIKFFLTGSLSLWYRRRIQENMAGRYTPFKLYPLTFPEYLEFTDKSQYQIYKNMFTETKPAIREIQVKNFNSQFRNFLEYGRFPEMIGKSTELAKYYLDSLVNGSLNQDVFSYFKIRKPNEMISLYEYLRINNGGELNVSKLQSNSSYLTIWAYLDILESMGLVDPVYNTANPLMKRKVSRKIYINSSLYLNRTKLNPLTAMGFAAESYVLERLLETKQEPITFYRKRNFEIDFILPKFNQAIEVKFRSDINDLSKLQLFCRSRKLDLTVVSLDRWGMTDGINFLPACIY